MKKRIQVLTLVSLLSVGSIGCGVSMADKLQPSNAVDGQETLATKDAINSTTIALASQNDVALATSQKETKAYENITFEAVDETGYIDASTLNIREDASTTSQVDRVLRRGDAVHVIGKSQDWYKVEIEGKTLYGFAKYISATKPKAPEAVSASADASGNIGLNPNWKYASFSKINSGKAVLYKAASNRKDITIAVNAGHGTKGGGNVKTLSHPDGTGKVTGGTNASGAVQSTAISSGMTFLDGTSEASATLLMARALRDELLARGYDVVMMRDGNDVQLDNIARSVIANNTANAHISLHWDSTASNKGAFYMSVPNVASYRAMEPVASTWTKHYAFGDACIAGLKNNGVKIFSGGSMEMDLTQTSYSTIPSIAMELGDRASDYSSATLKTHAKGLADGIGAYFGK